MYVLLLLTDQIPAFMSTYINKLNDCFLYILLPNTVQKTSSLLVKLACTMSTRSLPLHSQTSRDPFQLDRLAEELVNREEANHAGDDDADAHDLPDYVPLSHDNTYLVAKEFNVEQFLLSRSHTSLPDLRTELREYLSRLKEELVKLINDDYEAFISLSTDLKDEGDRLIRLKSPLGTLKSQVLVSKYISSNTIPPKRQHSNQGGNCR